MNPSYGSALGSVLLQAMDDAEKKAVDNLARYKFSNFGYWAATWVKYNQLAKDMGVIDKKRPSPFKSLVESARELQVSNAVVDLGGHWAEAFSKFGWGDGDNDSSGTDVVAQKIRALGYEVVTEFWGIHNYMVRDILKDGDMVISDEVRLGYDNPRDYLPSELISALDEAFTPYPEPALFD
jgi:hypothetical protein